MWCLIPESFGFLRNLFRRVAEKTPSAEGPDEILDAAVRGAQGLTSSEAVRVFRKAVRTTGGLDENAISEIVREKRRVLGRTPALSFHDDQSDLGVVGGLNELKGWLRERPLTRADLEEEIVALARGEIELEVDEA